MSWFHVHYQAIVTDFIPVEGEDLTEAKKALIPLIDSNPEYFINRLKDAVEEIDLESIVVTDILEE